jgi:RimJ/RimL family protein N-acetyltransferase
MSEEITLREFAGTWADCALVAAWRNDPDTAAAFPPGPLWTTKSEHAWYHGVYLPDPSLNFYFVCLDGKPIGTVGMRISGGKFEMMWMMLGDKSLARSGYMRQGMRKLMEAYGPGRYWGRVLPGNEAGLRFQIANGFEVTDKRDGFLVITRYFDGTWPE